MKKEFRNLLVISSFVATTILSSCGVGEKFSPTTDVFISEFYQEGRSALKFAMEIGTTSEKDKSLDGYKVNFYDKQNLAYSYTFTDEVFNKDNPIVFINSSLDLEVPNVKNIKLDKDYLYGKDYVEIVDPKGLLVDCIGNKDYQVQFINQGSLVRLKEAQKVDHKYDEQNFIRVKPGLTKYLGNIDAPVTKEELMYGPILDEELYGNLPFAINDYGTGGYREVKVESLGDGDTTVFSFNDGSWETGKVRYLMINTPEIDHGPDGVVDPQAWGEKAKEVNNDRLKHATSILVQSNKNQSMRESFRRTLGYVWYATKPNPKISDYRLLNHELVLLGLADFSLNDQYVDMYYGDVLYFDYLHYVYNYARNLGIKIHGEIDPTFKN